MISLESNCCVMVEVDLVAEGEAHRGRAERLLFEVVARAWVVRICVPALSIDDRFLEVLSSRAKAVRLLALLESSQAGETCYGLIRIKH